MWISWYCCSSQPLTHTFSNQLTPSPRTYHPLRLAFVSFIHGTWGYAQPSTCSFSNRPTRIARPWYCAQPPACNFSNRLTHSPRTSAQLGAALLALTVLRAAAHTHFFQPTNSESPHVRSVCLSLFSHRRSLRHPESACFSRARVGDCSLHVSF